MRTSLLGCLLAASASAQDMSFFVTSVGADGANFGGLAGADRHCQKLATAAGAGAREWRAYLSAAPEGKRGRVDARDRIGPGPWVNSRGVVIARSLDELHGDGNRLDRNTALTERGEPVPGDAHDVLTGSDALGRLAFSDTGFPATCANWASTGPGLARIGHADRLEAASWGNKRFPRWRGSWNSEHFTVGCGAQQLTETGGAGRLYCFAVSAPRSEAGASPAGPAFTFKRGLNVNHWLGDNLAPSLLPNASYAAEWFDEEDVKWIAAQGFDHLRIRVNGGLWVDREGDLDEARVTPFVRALGWARTHGLGVVLVMTGLPGFRQGVRGDVEPADQASPFTDEATQGDAAYLWWLVGRRFQDEDDGLRFELISSPTGDAADAMRSFNRRCLDAIRRTSARRMVYLTSHDMKINSASEVELGDARTALAIEFWEPEVFAFQADGKRPRVNFPGRAPDLSAFGKDDESARLFSKSELTVATIEARLDTFARSVASGREVYVASFGVFKRADENSTRAYVSAVRAAFERHGFSWALYDYHTGCAVRDGEGKATAVLHGLRLK